LRGATEGARRSGCCSLRGRWDARGFAADPERHHPAGRILPLGKGWRHDRKGLLYTPLSFSQASDGILVHCVHGQVKSAQAFDRQDLAHGEQFDRFQNGIGKFNSLPCAVPQFNVRPALPTRVRLSVEAAISRSSYSPRQSGHMGKAAIEVLARS